MMSRCAGALACLVAACGGGSATNDLAMSAATSMTVGASGGTVAASDGTEVTIPTGALASSVVITLAPAPTAPAPGQATVVGTAYTFGPEGEQFSTPTTITLAFDPSKIPSGKTVNSIVIATAPVGSSTYTNLTTTVVDATHVSAPTSHFSIFVPIIPLIGAPCSTNSDCPSGSVCTSLGVCTL